MTRQEWRDQIADIIHARFKGLTDDTIVAAKAIGATNAVLALIEQQGRTLWWCPSTQLGLMVNERLHCSPHRRGVFIEWEYVEEGV